MFFVEFCPKEFLSNVAYRAQSKVELRPAEPDDVQLKLVEIDVSLTNWLIEEVGPKLNTFCPSSNKVVSPVFGHTTVLITAVLMCGFTTSQGC